MTLTEEEINRLFRIRKTVMEMLRDRGYLVGDFEINMEKDDFLRKYGENMKREDLIISKAKPNDSADQVLNVVYCLKIRHFVLRCLFDLVFMLAVMTRLMLFCEPDLCLLP